MSMSPVKNKNILITGGAGFIGSHLTDELLSRGHRVTVLDNFINGTRANLNDAISNRNFTLIRGNILNPKVCLRAVRGIEVIYHLACLGVRHSLHSPLENHRVNAEGTLQVLEAARRVKTRFFYVSTSEIYGAAREFPLREETLARPTTVYGAGKLAGELYTNAFFRAYGLEATVLRIFNNYGPRAHYEGDAGEMIPRAIVSILYGRPPLLFNGGKNTRDFFYVKDTARALSGLLRLRGLAGRTLNIGTGREISMKALALKILRLMGREDLKPRCLAPRPADLPRLWVDARRFYGLTGFKARYSMEEGLKETIDYYTALARSKNLISKVKALNWKK